MKIEVDVAFAAENIVGESAVWDDRTHKLCWVDIVGKSIHRLCPRTGNHEKWRFQDLVTSIGLRDDGGAIVGLRKSIALWEFGGELRLVAEVEPDVPGNRLNEGVVAPDGAFWVGTMQDNIAADGTPIAMSAKTGRLYRYARGKLCPVSEDRFGITNTLIWTDDSRLITADTEDNAIYSYSLDAHAIVLNDRQTILSGFQRGLPDGSCVDAEGFIWNCRVAGGGCVVRFAPDGRIDRVVDLPCSWPTSCTFGGSRFETLFVTSARFTMGVEHLARNQHEGAVFALQPGAHGVPTNRFGR
ncbi:MULTISPECIES: SMP-30/gluconolactonase/LRE family protein [Ensifer]|uniref:SMP-30/gluconolactonase/LRE family protein n=1 Tax=Ensifer TaxID=106591 RepID=UPI00088DA5CB|nr:MULTISPECIES: SMP-30/gluconolactonase/LRE family protein [Ensifer]MBD9596020.1 SMP-30/gluconolactonase/LRE family protein [Ensifer sp. ENS05]MDF8356421.1 SMP-30/gluconolactonase/LRE family protein [Ensifer adhaerens]THA60558.1 SMP-30/gluconolactonase/LRE family protein [Ensifer adhaerens]SDM67369.1 Sugar lactone lactonase YvrE [Ensifer sp. YR511]